jgi:hypothetical protein
MRCRPIQVCLRFCGLLVRGHVWLMEVTIGDGDSEDKGDEKKS